MSEQKIHKCTVNPPRRIETELLRGGTYVEWGDPVVDPNRPCCKDWRGVGSRMSLEELRLNGASNLHSLTCDSCLYCHEEEE
jgi:hypothetical protein